MDHRLPLSPVRSGWRAWIVYAGFISTLALMVIGGALAYRSIQGIKSDSQWLEHSHEVNTSLDRFLGALTEAESDARGFVLTRQERFLDPYPTAVERVYGGQVELERLVSDNTGQRARLSVLKNLVREKLSLLDEGIALIRSGDEKMIRAHLARGRGKDQMDKVRAQVAEMRTSELPVLNARRMNLDQSYRTARNTIALTLATGALMVCLVMFLYSRHTGFQSRAGRVLTFQRERLRVTLASIGEGVMTTNEEGRINFMNPVAEIYTGWSLHEALDRPFEEVFIIRPTDDRPPAPDAIGQVLHYGASTGMAEDVNLIAKDGQRRPVDANASPILDAKGGVLGSVVVFRDITERKEAEEHLRESEQRLRYMLDSLQDKILTAGPGGDVNYCNPIWSAYTGLSFNARSTFRWDRFLHPDDLESTITGWMHSMRTGEPYQQEHRFRRADGEYRWHFSRTVPIRNDDGEIEMWIGSNTDIHDQWMAADRLRQLADELAGSDKRKDEFLAMLAHELRGPLAPLRNMLEVMRIAGPDQAVLAQAQDVMERQLGQLVLLVDDLMDVSRISKGKFELRPERIELAPVVRHAVEASRPLMDTAGHTLIVELPEEPVYLTADPARLSQILSNLLNNAAKYTDPGGRITLQALREGNEVILRVADNGIGIAREQMDRLFTLFSQLDHARERAQGGLGIGLSLVKRLTEMHGGRVEAHSEGSGRGSTFTIHLPVGVDAASERPVRPAQTPAAQARRILVVDDNKDGAMSLAMLLRKRGHQIEVAHDGSAALQAAAAFRPDVVLLDIGLPLLNGHQVAERIRSEPWGTDMVLIALTGWGQDEDRRRSEEAGFNAHLVKPVEFAELNALIP